MHSSAGLCLSATRRPARHFLHRSDIADRAWVSSGYYGVQIRELGAEDAS
ncbi:MAG: hypothetical protein JXA90_02245 [Planctomycetes bacterium]|nr:hypothetical protein [Planctomycetota bacterium]